MKLFIHTLTQTSNMFLSRSLFFFRIYMELDVKNNDLHHSAPENNQNYNILRNRHQDLLNDERNPTLNKNFQLIENANKLPLFRDEIESDHKNIKGFSEVKMFDERISQTKDFEPNNNSYNPREDHQSTFERQITDETSSKALKYLPITQADYDNVVDDWVLQNQFEANQIIQNQLHGRKHPEKIDIKEQRDRVSNSVHNQDGTQTNSSVPPERFYKQVGNYMNTSTLLCG